ncbi:MAG: hypothetical protein L6455_12455 [Kiritimatiellae bacterium]|nr:hypothetical protein [Verrucomicrobiota bacterium]MBU4289929.1 hypothetical protein [Verrucomicrobiota bacterium]MCG2680756.1 hypothetical protein [Kiritimatiellia bacterium]
MKYKPNWPETKERLTALWHHKPMDRPCIAVMVPNGKAAVKAVVKKVFSQLDKLDVEKVLK